MTRLKQALAFALAYALAAGASAAPITLRAAHQFPGGRGDVAATHVEWRRPSGGSYVPSVLYYDGLLYMTNDVGVVTCADARTGEPVWRHRLGGVFFASPVAGDGKVYLTSETGETIVMLAGREPRVLSRNDLGERLIASPAISNGRIFLRSDGTLFALGK